VTTIQLQQTATSTEGRFVALDVIREVALFRILFVNVGPQTRFGMESGFYGPFTFGDPSGWSQLLLSWPPSRWPCGARSQSKTPVSTSRPLPLPLQGSGLRLPHGAF
jgi:hypothetical protein